MYLHSIRSFDKSDIIANAFVQGVLFDIEDHMDRCYEGCKV